MTFLMLILITLFIFVVIGSLVFREAQILVPVDDDEGLMLHITRTGSGIFEEWRIFNDSLISTSDDSAEFMEDEDFAQINEIIERQMDALKSSESKNKGPWRIKYYGDNKRAIFDYSGDINENEDLLKLVSILEKYKEV